MEKKLIVVQTGEYEAHDWASKAKTIYKEDNRTHCMREEETGGKGNGQSKISGNN